MMTESFQYPPYNLLLSGDSSKTPFLFNGMYGVMTDSNGLYYMRARFYSPEIKRFVNQDILLGGIVEGQTLNRYAFVTGRPVLLIDPFGLKSCFTESHCIDQAYANYKNCNFSDAPTCGILVSTCAIIYSPFWRAVCVTARTTSCMMSCFNEWQSDKSLCELGIPIEGYRYQENYEPIDIEYGKPIPDSCYSQPDCYKQK